MHSVVEYFFINSIFFILDWLKLTDKIYIFAYDDKYKIWVGYRSYQKQYKP